MQNEKFKRMAFSISVYLSGAQHEKSISSISSALSDGYFLKIERYTSKLNNIGQQKNMLRRNVMLGISKKQDKSICTYYDTPPKNYGL